MSWVPEVGAYGGVGYKLGPGYLGAELRGTWASLNITQGPIHVKGLVGGFEGAAQYLLAF